MTSAPSRRRGAAVLAVAAFVVLVVLGASMGPGGAQVLCQDDDGFPIPCPTTTTFDGETTTSLDEETSTTEDTGDDETDSTEDTAPTDDEDEVIVSDTTLTVSTLNNVLIPGDGTEGAESTTTTAKALAGGNDGLSDEQLILLIVSGLVVVAGIVGLLTWRYWTATRPTVAEPRSAG